MVLKNRRAAHLLEEVLEHRMLLYALAVAGTSLASVPVSQAQIVFTPSDVTLNRYDTLQIDLNNDGNIDFTLHDLAGTVSFSCFAKRSPALRRPPDSGTCRSFQSYLNVVPATNKPSRGAIVGGQPFNEEAYALAKGANVDGGDAFVEPDTQAVLIRAASGNAFYGNFINVSDRFLGVRFQVSGQTHYGWIGFRSVTHGSTIQAVLAGWAYETQPEKPIRAGDRGEADSARLRPVQPTSLQLLAMGHTGIADRQKRIEAQTQG